MQLPYPPKYPSPQRSKPLLQSRRDDCACWCLGLRQEHDHLPHRAVLGPVEWNHRIGPYGHQGPQRQVAVITNRTRPTRTSSIFHVDPRERRDGAHRYSVKASDEEKVAAVKEACFKANADGCVASLQQGYDTPVGERGFWLSSGQLQRIVIARR